LFFVSFFYNVLVCNNGIYFPYKSIWRTKVSLKTAFFVWLAALEKILTMNNLRKQHVFVVDTCCTRKRNEESANHLLLHCEVACALWSTFFSCFGLSWVMPRVANLFACWWTSSSTQSAAVWKMVHSCLLWCLWKERNDRIFKDRKRTLAELQSLLFNSFHDFLVLISPSS
jgi:hypothetical protein